MKPPQLELFRGASVQIRLDGAEAIGILFFEEDGAPYITTLCYVQPGRECPFIKHLLSEKELLSLSRKSHNSCFLKSTVAVSALRRKMWLTRNHDERL